MAIPSATAGHISWGNILLGAIVSIAIGVGGAALLMWQNDSLQDNKILNNTLWNQRQDETDKEILVELRALHAEISAVKNSQYEWSETASEKLDRIIGQDRFRRRN